MPGPRDPAAAGWHGAGRHGAGWHPEWGEHGPPDWHAPRWVTLWMPVALSFAAQVPVALFTARFGDLGPRNALLLVLIAVAGSLLLIAARRFPGPVVAAIALLAASDLFVNPQGGPPYVALAFAIFGAIVRGARVWAWVSVAVAWIGCVTLAVVLGYEGWTPLRVAGTTLGILIVFGIGEAVRGRREQAAEFRRTMTQRRQSEMQAERVRIARELHDVLAHSLSQINVQAGVGLHLMERQPDQAAAALASIKDTSKTALDEVRSVLGALRSERSDPSAPLVPEPDLARLPALVAATPGVRVELDDRLDASTPRAVQSAFFRMVQESLTNITRHSDADSAVVRLWRERDVSSRAGDADAAERPAPVDVYRLEVRDTGRPRADSASEGGGRGLLGMRERAELLGGHLVAGPAEPTGFLVSATIPAPTEVGS